MKTNPVFYSCCSKHPLMKPHNGIWAPITVRPGTAEHEWAIRMPLMFRNQQIHRLLRQCYRADRVLCFGFRYNKLPIDPVYLLIHRELTVFDIQVCPKKCEQFSSPQAAGQFQEEHLIDAKSFCLVQIFTDLLRRQDRHFLLLFLRNPAVIAGIKRNDPFFHCLLECSTQYHMSMAYHTGR